MFVKKILDKLNLLLKVPSVVRFEKPLLSYLESYCSKNENYEIIKSDKLLSVKRKNSISNKLLSIHIDRHGFVVNDSGKIEYAAFSARNFYNLSIDADTFVLNQISTRFIGELVYSYDSLTGEILSEGKIIKTHLDLKNKSVFFDVEGIENLVPGTPLSLKSELVIDDNFFYSQIDNSISVAVALQLIDDGFDGTILFTTEEEIGLSWKHIFNYLNDNSISTQELVVLDTSPYRDIKLINDGCIFLRHRDETGTFNVSLIKSLTTICNEKNILFEFKDDLIELENMRLKIRNLPQKHFGHTELGRLVEHTEGVLNGVTIQIPSVNYHTNKELSSLKSLENFYFLLNNWLFN